MSLFLACRYPVYEPKFVIYPRVNKIELSVFSSQDDYVSTTETTEYIIVTMSTCAFYIRKFCYPDLATLLLTTKESIIIDIERSLSSRKANIWCKAETYQLFDDDISSIVPTIEDEVEEPLTFGTRINLGRAQELKPTLCYICKRVYDPIYKVEPYHSMCVECGLFNHDKRLLRANLTGVAAVVTGIRKED